MTGTLAEFKNKRVLIMGLGLDGGGVGAARFFAAAGARVTVTDLRSARELVPPVRALKGLSIRYVLGRHRTDDFARADLVIQNPGVPDSSPYLGIARRAGVAVDADVFGPFLNEFDRGAQFVPAVKKLKEIESREAG